MGRKRTHENHFQTGIPHLEGSRQTRRLSLNILSHQKPARESNFSSKDLFLTRGIGGVAVLVLDI